MAKTAFKFDIDLLKTVVKQVESESKFNNLSELYVKVSEKYNECKSEGKLINPPLVGLRIKEYNIPVLTEKGKRGRVKGEKVDGVKIPRSIKFASTPTIVKHFDGLERYLRKEKLYERYGKLLKKAKEGSVTASIKLHCLECCNFVTEEVRECQSDGTCSLWHLRPFK